MNFYSIESSNRQRWSDAKLVIRRSFNIAIDGEIFIFITNSVHLCVDFRILFIAFKELKYIFYGTFFQLKLEVREEQRGLKVNAKF